MSIVPLPLPPGAESRALLHHVLEHGDIVGRDPVGRAVFQLAVDDGTLEKLMAFADAADLGDGGDNGTDADKEKDGTPVLVDLVSLEVLR